MSKFKRNLYCKEKFIYEDGMHKLIESSDGTLFSGQRRTKIYEYELPEWYLRGTFYRREGYLSVKGITDLLYVPNMHINHFLRDDYLLIAYGGKITPNNDFETYPYEKYLGYDERVWGGEILDVLKGARKYSDMDIAPIIEQIKKKQQCFKENHPRDYQSECGNFDADACFREDFDNRHHPKYYSIALDDYFTLAFSSFAKQYYGTLKDIEEFTELLDPERYKGLLAAFRQFKAGNTKVTHTIASGETKQLLTPVNGETSLNAKRQQLQHLLLHMNDLRSSEVLIPNGGIGYRFNAEGNQVSYKCDVKRVTTINFDRNAVRKHATELSRKADEISAEIDKCVVNTAVDYIPPFDVNDSFAEVFEKYAEA